MPVMPRLNKHLLSVLVAFLAFMDPMLIRAEPGKGDGVAELKQWRVAVKSAVAPNQSRHSFHAYFNTSPESPDGKHVLYYTSGAADGETGDLRVLERATGRESIIARDIRTEDAHRAACQQWSGGGTQVLYHNLTDGRWSVHAVDIATGRDRVLAQDRQLGFGSATGRWAPVYGCHWNPGEYRNLELIDVISGQTIVAVDPRYFRPAEVETLLGDPTKAKEKLGWVPQITLQEMITEMVACDHDEAKKHALLKSQGYHVAVSRE